MGWKGSDRLRFRALHLLESSYIDDLGWMLKESADRWCWIYSLPSVVFDVYEGYKDHPGDAKEGGVIWNKADENVDPGYNGCEWYEVNK